MLSEKEITTLKLECFKACVMPASRAGLQGGALESAKKAFAWVSGQAEKPCKPAKTG